MNWEDKRMGLADHLQNSKFLFSFLQFSVTVRSKSQLFSKNQILSKGLWQTIIPSKPRSISKSWGHLICKPYLTPQSHTWRRRTCNENKRQFWNVYLIDSIPVFFNVMKRECQIQEAIYSIRCQSEDHMNQILLELGV